MRRRRMKVLKILKSLFEGYLAGWLLIFSVSLIKAEPGYLDFDNLPETNFTCVGKVIGGYYADPETSCQMFHVCTIGQGEELMDIKFLCLNGTVFDQETRVCERVDEVDCSKSEKFYYRNLELYGNTMSPSPDDESEDIPISHTSTTTSTTTTTTTTTTRRPYVTSSFPSLPKFLFNASTFTERLNLSGAFSPSSTKGPQHGFVSTTTTLKSIVDDYDYDEYGDDTDPDTGYGNPKQFTFGQQQQAVAAGGQQGAGGAGGSGGGSTGKPAISFQQQQFQNVGDGAVHASVTTHHSDPAKGHQFSVKAPAQPPKRISLNPSFGFGQAAPPPQSLAPYRIRAEGFKLQQAPPPPPPSRTFQGYPVRGQLPPVSLPLPFEAPRNRKDIAPSAYDEHLAERSKKRTGNAEYDEYAEEYPTGADLASDARPFENLREAEAEENRERPVVALRNATRPEVAAAAADHGRKTPRPLPKAIHTVSVSVSDQTGKKLNLSLANVLGDKQALPVPVPVGGADEEELIIDPFFLDVPKIKKAKTRRKRALSV